MLIYLLITCLFSTPLLLLSISPFGSSLAIGVASYPGFLLRILLIKLYGQCASQYFPSHSGELPLHFVRLTPSLLQELILPT